MQSVILIAKKNRASDKSWVIISNSLILIYFIKVQFWLCYQGVNGGFSCLSGTAIDLLLYSTWYNIMTFFIVAKENGMKIILWIIAIIFIVGLLTLTGVFKVLF